MKRSSFLLTAVSVGLIMGGLMFGWLGKKGASKPATDSPQTVAPAQSRHGCAPSFQSLVFDTSDLRHERDEQERRLWLSPEGDAVTLNVFNQPPDLPDDLRSVEQLRQFYISQLSGSPARLVEVATANAGGCGMVRLILKSPQQPSGMTYVGSLTIPFRDFSFVVKVQCGEQGVTGVRDTVLFDTLLGEKKVTFDPTSGKITGNWNPDDMRYDAMFPDHPLSRLRRRLRAIAGSLKVEEAVRSQPPFPLPP